ncbi:Swt1 family HEPN domain-containing protein [Nonomuraea sp. NPDC026600]|uniref:Swt1 family HEPN domain-containing protein n=1 Tax=Nonomuraea sp. NPDC026600 TaxID=3155363 RepID=UPI0033E5EB6B
MALSNRDRVNRGFEILSEGLEPIVDQLMQAAAPVGKDWLELLAAKESNRHGGGPKFSKNDVQLQLKMITDYKNIFFDLLSHSGMRFASELRDTRNAWAHMEKFSSDDTYRALDTIERLLNAMGAVSATEEIRVFKADHQRASYETHARDKVRKNAPVALAVDGHGLKSWREVMTPHPDVRTGRYASAEFAADLHQVAVGKSTSDEYADPIQFFRRTYLTDGLKELLTNAARRISGDGNAEPVFNLQTNFGGGKTHSMLALWHLYAPGRALADYPQPVLDMLGDIPLESGVRRVALVGNHIETAKASHEGGRPGINTLWGELAWQLGGQDAFDFIAAADEARTPPGASLQQLLEAYAPCVILIDEWVAYARLLHGRNDLPGGTFEAQFTFAQTLTEVAKAVPGVMVVVSVPASHDPRDDASRADDTEVGGVRGQEALGRLQHVVGRVAKHWRPASSDESFEIVRRRLFEEPTAQGQKDRDVIAKALMKFYRDHSSEFPRDAVESTYEDEIKRAYPIHPELFHRLYEDWSTLERFQKTRGVLRLMSAVIYRLWEAEDPAPLIMPGSLPLSDEWVLGEVTHYLSDTWKAVIEADVDAPNSTPERIDKSRDVFHQRHLTRRLARAAFLGSAARSGASNKGVERKRIWLATALPGDVVGNFGSAIHLLSEQALYFYADGTAYWYDTQQSVNRMARDRAEEYRSHPEDVYAEIVRRIKERDFKEKGLFLGTYPAPAKSDDIQDMPDVRLVIVHPRHHYSSQVADNPAYNFVTQALDSRGNSPRDNKNMLTFAVADHELLGYLMESVREYLAWNSIVEEKDLPLLPDQAAMARKRRKTVDETVWLRLTQAYNTVYYPIWDETLGRIAVQAATVDEDGTYIPERVGTKLRNLDKLRVVMGSRLIRHDLEKKLPKVWANGHVSFGDLWQYYCRFPYLGRLRNRRVLEEGILGVFDEITGDVEGFAIAHSYDEEAQHYVELVIPGTRERVNQITDGTLLVELTRAKAQRAQEDQAKRPVPDPDPGFGDGGDSTTGNTGGGAGTAPGPGPVPPPSPPAAKNTRFWGTYQVNPERHSRDLNRLSQDLLALLTAPEGVELEVRVEISARCADGFPDKTVFDVLENLGHLKIEGKFEDI